MPESIKYQNWNVSLLENRWIKLYALPQLGGRLIQLEMDGHDYFFVNPLLAGVEPGPSRLGDNGTWLNFGGEKIWPAPQGWDSSDQWPGPPDPVLDSGEYAAELGDNNRNALRLTSPADQYTGLQVIKDVFLSESRTEVIVTVNFKNTSDTLKHWSIWPVIQMNTSGEGEERYYIVCPANRESLFSDGYNVMHGLVNNPQYSLNAYGNVQVDYHYLVGKIGMDSTSGWAAFADKKKGKVFVVLFPCETGKTYPNNTSFQVWTSGCGMVYSRNVIRQHADDKVLNPPYMEMELLSPIHEIAPGREVQFEYQMLASTIPAGETVECVNEVGVIASSFTWMPEANGIYLKATYGVFTEGVLKIQFQINSNRETQICLHEKKVCPLQGIHIGVVVARELLTGDFNVTAELFDFEGHLNGLLDKIAIQSDHI